MGLGSSGGLGGGGRWLIGNSRGGLGCGHGGWDLSGCGGLGDCGGLGGCGRLGSCLGCCRGGCGLAIDSHVDLGLVSLEWAAT